MATFAPPQAGSSRVDYYGVLGVRTDATYREIGDAYWRLAAERRDLLPILNEAYEILNDPRRRMAYNAVRKTPPPSAAELRADVSGWIRVRGKLKFLA